MDEALKKEIDGIISAAVAAALEPVVSQVGQAAEAVKKIGDIENNLKVVSETMAQQKLLSPEDVRALLAQDLAAREAAAAEAAKASEASAALKAKREAFAAEKLKGVPARYHDALGDDESKWAEAEKAIRETFAADLKAAGVKVADVGGSAGGEPPAGGGKPAATMVALPDGLAAFAGA